MLALIVLAGGCTPSAGDGPGTRTVTGAETPTGSDTQTGTGTTQDSGTPPSSTDTAVGTTSSPTTAGIGSADCADAPVEIAARDTDVRKVCLYADGVDCVVHADDPAATSCAVHPSLLNFEWNLGPPEERRLLEFYGWTAVSHDAGTLVEGQGIEPDALDLTELALGTPITVAATHDDSGSTYQITFAFESDSLTLTSVVNP